jgi:H+/Cl- antiporter ClcA
VPNDPFALLRTKKYVALLVICAVIGVPISAGAYYFLWLTDHVQIWTYQNLPHALGWHTTPVWWCLPLLILAGLVVALTITYLPGTGGHVPADGFSMEGGPAIASWLPGIFICAVVSIGLGAVIGPEAPLIALGGGLAALVIRTANKDAPAQTVMVIGAAGSFAAIAALLGSPLTGAFLLMEVVAFGGPLLTVVLLPGLLASGIGFLVFDGLNSLTGLGVQTLALPGLPPFAHPNGAEMAWALAIGVGAALLGSAIRWVAFLVRPVVEKRRILFTPVAGALVAGLAIAYSEISGKNVKDVLFSGQSDLPTLIHNSASYAVGTLVLLLACKGLAYGISLSSFRGGPIFPAIFIGGASGVLMSHLPGLPLVPAVAMGIGAMCAVQTRLPMTSVLLATLLMSSDGLAVMPLVILAVAVAFVVATWITPLPVADPAAAPAPAPDPSPAAAQEPAPASPAPVQ